MSRGPRDLELGSEVEIDEVAAALRGGARLENGVDELVGPGREAAGGRVPPALADRGIVAQIAQKRHDVSSEDGLVGSQARKRFDRLRNVSQEEFPVRVRIAGSRGP
ncbi:hypothetical protein TorRG33x02_334400 [Trema orientale]|uniref:Uncharacterized protein n=1 Tax=Trema orientale TaxID=63057 RepID=A0A2P5B2S5_TREOI|nr:hypothetical protein TorRG33x02_334400 [Trema orientale]